MLQGTKCRRHAICNPEYIHNKYKGFNPFKILFKRGYIICNQNTSSEMRFHCMLIFGEKADAKCLVLTYL